MAAGEIHAYLQQPFHLFLGWQNTTVCWWHCAHPQGIMTDVSQRWPPTDLKVRLWSGYGPWNEGGNLWRLSGEILPDKRESCLRRTFWRYPFILEILRCEIAQLGAAAVFRVLWKETLHAHQRYSTERLKEQGPQWHFWAFETLWDNLFPVLDVPFKCYLENVHPYGLSPFICITCYLQPRTFPNNKVDNF